MTTKTLSGLILIVIVSLISLTSYSNQQSVSVSVESGYTDDLSRQTPDGNQGTNKIPFFPPKESKGHHGKLNSPQMDELAHMHKFHKERVKKIKKHHDKFWLLSKLILILCHLSILVIAYLHATH